MFLFQIIGSALRLACFVVVRALVTCLHAKYLIKRSLARRITHNAHFAPKIAILKALGAF